MRYVVLTPSTLNICDSFEIAQEWYNELIAHGQTNVKVMSLSEYKASQSIISKF